MKFPGFTARRTMIRLAGVAVVLIAGAVVLGWRAGETAVPPLPPLAKDAWSTVTASADDPVKDFQIMRGRHPWTGFLDMTKRLQVNRGPAAAAAAAARRPAPVKPKVPWRLAGIILRGDESFVLIATGQAAKTTLEYRRVGDSLPDGSILVQIMPDSAKTQPAPSAAPPSENPEAPPPEKPETIVYRLFDKK
jgi:hypothetical protein